MVHQLRHRCPKGAATVEMNLLSPRHISTLLMLRVWSVETRFLLLDIASSILTPVRRRSSNLYRSVAWW